METHFENIERAHSILARNRVIADLRTLARDAEDLLKATAGDMSDKAKEARVRLREGLERVRAACIELEKQTVAAAKAAADQADDLIRGHPYESISLVFGLGVVIGALISRRWPR
jgi:ElaB/YqjD/DUF883 family membrane-anchored ribosome-binding protein